LRDGRARAGWSFAPRAYADFLVHADRPVEARDVLQPTLAWFNEGRDTMDYVYAETLLRTLDAVPSP